MFPVSTRWWGSVTGVAAKDFCTTRYRWDQNRPGAMTKPLGISISVTLRQGESKLPPLQTSFSNMEDKDPYDLVLRKHDSHTRAISCIRGRRYANRARLSRPPQPFSFPSLLSPLGTRADSKPCCTGVCRSYATQYTADRKEFLCISRSGRYGILRLAWWHRIDRDGRS
jgi:hypothetical protein